MACIYRNLRAALPRLMDRTGARTVFEAAIFKELVSLATDLSRNPSVAISDSIYIVEKQGGGEKQRSHPLGAELLVR